MQRAMQLAALGNSFVAPNPMVGCVIVHNNCIIGEGYHQQFGGPHAEVNAINSVENKELLAHSELYVSLEPCSHFGKTPPCVNLIVEHKIPKVVVACLDPNPQVAGKGVEFLRNKTIEVEVGMLEKESFELNERFICFHTQKRPFITLKWAQTADGFMGRLDSSLSSKITNEYSDVMVHQLRSEHTAILVGFNTALKDNPKLNNRHWIGSSPLRVVIDLENQLPSSLELFNDSIPTLKVVYEIRTNLDAKTHLIINKKQPFLPQLLEQLYQLNVQSILVEGGAKTLNHFISKNLWDKAHVFTSKQYWQNGINAPKLTEVTLINEEFIKHDRIQIFKPILQV